MCDTCLKLISKRPMGRCIDCNGHYVRPTREMLACDECGGLNDVLTAWTPEGPTRLCLRHLAEQQRDERDEREVSD